MEEEDTAGEDLYLVKQGVGHLHLLQNLSGIPHFKLLRKNTSILQQGYALVNLNRITSKNSQVN